MNAPLYDLLVIGGGINGAGIARDAAGRGLSILLVEQDDLASATSQWSTKLIHGGLRYLEYYEFRLVGKHERERLDEMRRDAQHHLALGERFGHEPEFVVLEVAQAPVDQLGAPLRGGGGDVVLLDDQHRKAAARCIPGKAGAVDAGADDDQIVVVSTLAGHGRKPDDASSAF